MKYFKKKGHIIRRFLLFLVPYIRFLIKSLKLIKQLFFKIQLGIWMLKRIEIFQHFLENFNQLKIFLLPR